MIAAAGKSSRMGFPKALLKFDDQPVIISSLMRLKTIRPARLFVTLPAGLFMDEHLRSQLAELEVVAVPNLFMHLGYAGSIKTVTEQCEFLDGLMISPVDAPLFDEKLLLAMINLANLHAPHPTIIVPYYGAKPGHPVYVSEHFFTYITQSENFLSLRALIKTHPEHHKVLLWPDHSILCNFNTLNPAISMGDKAAREAPGVNCSKPSCLSTISKAPKTLMRSMSST